MTQYLTYDMNDKILTQGKKAFRKWAVRRVRTVGSPYSDCESAAFGLLSSLGLSSHMLRHAAMLVMLLVMGTTGAWADDFTGIWYIGSDNSASGHPGSVYDSNEQAKTYYLVPAANPQQLPSCIDAYYSPNHGTTNGDPLKPFLTTFKTNQDYNSVWVVVPSTTSGFYYVIHVLTGKYVIYEPPLPNDGDNQRKSMHLQNISDTGYSLSDKDDYNFEFTGSVTGSINIRPKNRSGWYWNPAGQNSDAYYGNGSPLYRNGLVGLWTATTGNSIWHFESAILPAPTINNINEDGKVTVTENSGWLPAGYNVRYEFTADPSTPADPTASSPIMPADGYEVVSEGTIKVVIERYGVVLTTVASKHIVPLGTPDDPVISLDECTNTFTITAGDAVIYYTTDGSEPSNTNGTLYEGPFQLSTSVPAVKAVSYLANNRSVNVTTSAAFSPKTLMPTITVVGNKVTIAGSGTIYYTDDQSDPTSSGTRETYSGTITLPNATPSQSSITIRACATEAGKGVSCISSLTVQLGIFINNIAELNSITATSNVILANDIDASGYTGDIDNFSGSFDGGMFTISGLTKPLFNSIDGGTVKNVILKNVAISSSDDYVGAIAGIAQGYSRIYNCGILPNYPTFPEGIHPTVTGGTCAGGIVGKLDGDSRVINCFSYADVSASTYAAGIVGNNTFASTAAVSGGKYTKLRTAVVNCMFYGNITGGTNQYGVYGGTLITNADATGINSYNYYRDGSTFTTATGEPTAYNCSFPADERYLTQVEFHRSLLNSNRELCGWWVGSDVAPSTLTTAQVQAIPKDASLMAKWVLDPAVAPYPILKPFGKYASIVNNPGNETGRTLTVKVQSGSHSTATDRTLDIPITDMDPEHHDYGYCKIQLPYFNTVFGNPEGATWAEKYAGNYTDYVVTGWKVTAVTTDGSVESYNSFSPNWQDGYNFADRKCTAKDIYNAVTNPRVFAQGGYYYVPDGVTGITIEAYWGKAIYVRNNQASYDRVNITKANTGSHFAPAGTRDNNINGATIQETSKLSDALTNTNIDAKMTVYDYALVLVGNLQESVGGNDVKHATQDTRGFTIMSVDLDFDEEPDYCLEWQLGNEMQRQVIAPIRFDFLPVVELGIAEKLNGSTYFLSLGCYRSKGHFEVTETAFIRFGQFEFELGSRDDGPIILNGGIYEQYCRGRNGETNQHITYVILGGHIVMPSFTPGAHVNAAAKYKTRHCAVNALGGNFTSFYLTGGYNEGIEPYENDNPHCYIDGGRFGTVAAAYKEGIWGNVTWRINHALIDEFYGGGVMSQATGTTYKIVKGNIDVVIDNSTVGKYCGGPKFGDMVSGKTVTTRATNTTFNQYFGAGNGGTNYVQYASTDVSNSGPYNVATWTTTVNNNYTVGKYRSTDYGYEANYDLEVINTSTGDLAGRVVNRSYYYSAQFATTNTGNVTNILTGCTIGTNFYGGGFLGGVNGSVTSTLTDTRVYGSAYGAGYSASAGTVTIYNKDKTPPSANVYTGMIKPQIDGTYTTYYWTHDKGSTGSPITTEGDIKYFYTEVPLDNLGAVTGAVTLTIDGNSIIGTSGTGDVYGGGDASAVNNTTTPTDASTTVILKGNAQVKGNVYGGGNHGIVSGSTEVNIKE